MASWVRAALVAAPVPLFAMAILIMAVPEWRGYREAMYEENGPMELLIFAGFLAAAVRSFMLARRDRVLHRDP